MKKAPSTNTAAKCGVFYGKVPYPVFFFSWQNFAIVGLTNKLGKFWNLFFFK
jgi:hypothetical protein